MSKQKHIINDGPLYDIRVLSTTQVCELYGIEVEDDGSVWDPVEGKSFETLTEWAEYYIEVNEDLDNFSKIGKHQDWDDDY